MLFLLSCSAKLLGDSLLIFQRHLHMITLLKPVTGKVVSVKRTHKPDNNFQWYVFYTCPRSEKVVYNELINRGYEVFLPVMKTLKLWKNRQKKWIDQVLFPSYIFVYTRQLELYYITQVPKIVNYIQCAGRPSVISLKEIEGIKKMLCLEQNVSVEVKFCKGEKVKIINGPLVGYEGILVKQNGKTRFGIQLKEINITVLINIDTKVLEKV